MELGSPDGVFGCSYAKTTVNLACRGDNTNQVCLKHFKWDGDAVGIPFAHEKTNQAGNDPTKKLPRRCFCNPLKGQQTADMFSSDFHYLVLHPDILSNPDRSFLQGSQDAQSSAFNRVLKKVLTTNVDGHGVPLCESKYGVPIEEITMYSYRKCAHTKLNCGSTAGPSSAACCLREGHSIGTVRNVYIAQERASDEYCGRILSGLPINDASFAASYPDFIPIPIEIGDDDRILPVTDAVYKARQEEVDRKVEEVLYAIFTEEHMSAFPEIHRFLRCGLAAHLIHFEEIDAMLPPDAKLRMTPLYTNPLVLELKEHVRIAMPWEDHHIYYSEASGLPPHVIQLNQMEQLKSICRAIPDKLEALLDRRQMNGPVSLEQIRREVRVVVETSPTMRKLEEAVALILRANELRSPAEEEADAAATAAMTQRYEKFPHPDGVRRRVPPGWKLPTGLIQHAYVYWHCGDPAKKIAPIKMLDKRDLSILEKKEKKCLGGMRRLMDIIDRAAIAEGVRPKKELPMTQAEANACFIKGRNGIQVTGATPSGRPRNVYAMTWQSVLRLLPSAKK